MSTFIDGQVQCENTQVTWNTITITGTGETNDLIAGCFGAFSSIDGIIPPAGWTELTKVVAQPEAGNSNLFILFGRLASTGPFSIDVEMDSPVLNDKLLQANWSQWRNATDPTLIEYSEDSQTEVMPAVTTSNDNSAIYRMACIRRNTSGCTLGPPHIAIDSVLGNSNNSGCNWYYNQATAGDTGTADMTIDPGWHVGYFINLTLAIAPSGAPQPSPKRSLINGGLVNQGLTNRGL